MKQRILFHTLLDNGRHQAAVKGTPDETDFRPVVNLFHLCGAATGLLTDIEPDDHSIAWGLCDLGMGCPEFGTVNLAELHAFRGRIGLGIERDLHFESCKPISATSRKSTGMSGSSPDADPPEAKSLRRRAALWFVGA